MYSFAAHLIGAHCDASIGSLKNCLALDPVHVLGINGSCNGCEVQTQQRYLGITLVCTHLKVHILQTHQVSEQVLTHAACTQQIHCHTHKLFPHHTQSHTTHTHTRGRTHSHTYLLG
jgi:hypothetical protein